MITRAVGVIPAFKALITPASGHSRSVAPECFTEPSIEKVLTVFFIIILSYFKHPRQNKPHITLKIDQKVFPV
jgi:hypothetical protein